METSKYRTLICSILGLLFFLLLPGCQLSYYKQAMKGQYGLVKGKQPIPQLLMDSSIDPALKQKLTHVMEIREFAETELALPVEENYLHYVDLQRDYVVWNVFACPPLSLTSKKWCFPVVGCMTYRGYFVEEAAKTYAGSLREENLDVYVGGVPAYSTLGWFKDPLTNVILRRSNERLAELIFHELAHQILYVKDDTAFNESFATAVAHEGIRRWLKLQNRENAVVQVEQGRRRHKAFVTMVLAHRDQLGAVYRSDLSDDLKLKQKQKIIAELKDQYQVFKSEWNNYTGYDRWIDQPINNAQLNTISTYYDHVPAFINLLKTQDMDLKNFYTASIALSKLDKGLRQVRLTALANQGDIAD